MNRRTFIKAVGAALAAVFGPRVAAEARAEAVPEAARIYDDFTRASDVLASEWTAPDQVAARIGLYGGGDLTDCPYDTIVVRVNLRPVEFTAESCKTAIGGIVFDAESQKLQHGAHWITLSDGEWHFTYTDQFGNVHES
jgi:hypothetical protein